MDFRTNGFTVGKYNCQGSESLLGKGSFADVYLGTNTETGEKVAIKVIDVLRLTKGKPDLKSQLEAELDISASLIHPNIVCLLDKFKPSENQVVMILEYCAEGDLAKYLSVHKNLSETEVQYFMKQFAAGLKFMRSKSILHRDLKPQNLLLSKNESGNLILKIADFGFARVIDSQQMAETLCGSPLYMAPEILKLQKYNVKSDLWSVGVIMFEMLANTTPYPAKSHFDLIQSIENKPIPFKNMVVSKECKDLISSLLQRDPMQRISWEEFFLNPWLGLHSLGLPSIQEFSPIATPSMDGSGHEKVSIGDSHLKDSSDYQLDSLPSSVRTSFVEHEENVQQTMLAEFEKKTKRAYVISSIADMKNEQRNFGESFCLYVKSLNLLQKAIEFAKKIAIDSMVTDELHSSLEKMLKTASDKYLDNVRKAQDVESLIPKNIETAVSPEKNMYIIALHLGREAAVLESNFSYSRCEGYLERGLLLLQQLYVECDKTAVNDKEILKTYIVSFEKRLSALGNKMRDSKEAEHRFHMEV